MLKAIKINVIGSLRIGALIFVTTMSRLFINESLYAQIMYHFNNNLYYFSICYQSIRLDLGDNQN